MPDTHEERIRAAFTPQAATFEDARLNVAFTSSVPWLLDHMAPRVDDIVLDVAGGTGIVSRALAHRVAHAVVVDSTPAMIDAGRRHATDERLTNLEFVRGEVANLPFADAAFTLVFARFALHHLTDPRPALAEMVRVCGLGGRVVVMDLAASTDPRSPNAKTGLSGCATPLTFGCRRGAVCAVGSRSMGSSSTWSRSGRSTGRCCRGWNRR